jgi:GTPase SAR1 family protein
VWVRELAGTAEPGIPVVVVGNKIDLANERVIPTWKGERFAQRSNFQAFYETSALTRVNVNEAFTALARFILAGDQMEEFTVPAGRRESVETGCCFV